MDELEIGVLVALSKRRATMLDLSRSRLGGGFTPLRPSTEFRNPLCSACGAPLAPIFYISAPLYDVAPKRALHVFACAAAPTRECCGSWVVIRDQIPSAPKPSASSTAPAPSPPPTPTKTAPSSSSSTSASIDSWSLSADFGSATEGDKATSDWDSLVEAATEVTKPKEKKNNAAQKPRTPTKPTARASPAKASPIKSPPSAKPSLTPPSPLFPDLETDIFATSETTASSWSIPPSPSPSQSPSPSPSPSQSQSPSPSLCTSSSSSTSPLTADLSEKGTVAEHLVPMFYVDWRGEPSRKVDAKADPHIQKLLDEYLKENPEVAKGHEGEGGGDNDEVFEDMTSAFKNMYKFQKKMELLPNQCLRYCFEGVPLLYSDTEGLPLIPDCPFCGAQRVFECQVMPGLLATLPRLDFATVLIFTCGASCQSAQFQPEICIRQSAI